MRSVRYLAVLAVVLLSASVSHAQVSFGIGIGGPVYGGYYGPPACQYGYYSYYPYACAPYGYYGPQWFNGGVFIGAGPWFRGGWGDGDGDRWGGWGDGDGDRWGGWHGEGWRGGEGWHGGDGWRGGEGWHGEGRGRVFAGNRGFAGRGGWHGGGRGGWHGGGHGGGRR